MSNTGTLDRATPSTLPVAGWYDDPAGSRQLRWWGGLAWTEHVKPAEAAAAPVVEISTTIAYGAAQGYRPFAADRYQPNFRTPPTARTAAIWILALSPILSVAVLFFAVLMGSNLPQSFALSACGAQIAFMLGFIIWDRTALRRLGLTPSSAWWLLLPHPILYLIVRRVGLKRQGVVSNAPSNVYVLVLLAAAGLAWLLLSALSV